MNENEIAKKLGIKIRMQRESHKMSLQQAADLIGVSEDEMNRFESGESCIDVFNLRIYLTWNLHHSYMVL
ncbi:helix-turn-helix domain-containing protein [Providencia alcalifaciens]